MLTVLATTRIRLIQVENLHVNELVVYDARIRARGFDRWSCGGGNLE